MMGIVRADARDERCWRATLIVELAPAVADLAPGEELAFDVLLTNDGEQAGPPVVAVRRHRSRTDPDRIGPGRTAGRGERHVPCVLRLPAMRTPGTVACA
jgi:hypothetical protein